MDVPAIAVSVTNHDPKHYEYAAKFSADLTKLVVQHKLKTGTLLNVNVRIYRKKKLQAFFLLNRVNRSGMMYMKSEKIPYGKNYYWLTGNLIQADDKLVSDQFAVYGRIMFL